MNKKELTVAGAMIYACEGAKIRKDLRGKNTYYYAVEVTNSTPAVISLFVKFLIEIIKVDKNKIKGQLFIYPDQDEQEIKEFWSKKSGIPLGQFQKVIRLKEKVSKYKPNPLGTFKIRYNDKNDFLKIQDIINRVWRDARVVE